MEGLSDQLLLETYKKAKQLNLDAQFIQMLADEVERRNETKDRNWQINYKVSASK